jgi:hypothetical protein
MINDLPTIVIQFDLQPKNLFQSVMATTTTEATPTLPPSTVVDTARITVIDFDFAFRTTRLSDLFFLLTGADNAPLMTTLGVTGMMTLFGRNLSRYIAASRQPFTAMERRLLPHVLAHKALFVMRHLCMRGKDLPGATRNFHLFHACIDQRELIRTAMDTANERFAVSSLALSPSSTTTPIGATTTTTTTNGDNSTAT